MNINGSLTVIWQHPLFGLLLTLLAFQCGKAIYQSSGNKAWLQPILVAVVLIICVLSLLDISYETYFQGAELIHLFLGPVVVALAYPLYQHSARIKQMLRPIMITIPVAAVMVTATAMLTAWLLGAERELLMTLAPKTATTAIAILVSEAIGGIAALTAVFVILTGIAGAVAGPWLLSKLHIRDHAIIGISMGLGSHAVGTSRALEISEECGAFSALAMSLTGCFIALTIPFLGSL